MISRVRLLRGARARPGIIDTDPGIDDALALLFALRSSVCDVRAVTTVAGNIGIETTTRNALDLLAFAGCADIPVAMGAAAPLVRPGVLAVDVHGANGLGGIALAASAQSACDLTAHEMMAEQLMMAPPASLDILALGPLTNLALLIREFPAAAQRIGRLIVMGGAIAVAGNVHGKAEFNLACDPEAAALVFNRLSMVTLIPLDVTRKVRALASQAATLAAMADDQASLAGRLITSYFERTATDTATSRPLHDPCVIACAAQPELFSCQTLALSVDCSDTDMAGAVRVGSGGAPVSVAMDVDAPAVLALLLEGWGAADVAASA